MYEKQTWIDGTSIVDAEKLNHIEDGIYDVALKEYVYEVLEAGYDIDTLNRSGIFGIFNASGTLPSGYSTSDNNVFIQSMIWGLGDWGRQVLYDIRSNNIYSRNLNNGVWQSWHKITTD